MYQMFRNVEPEDMVVCPHCGGSGKLEKPIEGKLHKQTDCGACDVNGMVPDPRLYLRDK